jgi:hypothetical protein
MGSQRTAKTPQAREVIICGVAIHSSAQYNPSYHVTSSAQQRMTWSKVASPQCNTEWARSKENARSCRNKSTASTTSAVTHVHALVAGTAVQSSANEAQLNRVRALCTRTGGASMCVTRDNRCALHLVNHERTSANLGCQQCRRTGEC